LPPLCVGDCDGDGQVAVNELLRGIAISLGNASVEMCPAFDANGDGLVLVDEIVKATNNALLGCGVLSLSSQTQTQNRFQAEGSVSGG
jgi:hypothetical protein